MCIRDSSYECMAKNGYTATLYEKEFGFVCTIYALDEFVERLIQAGKYDKIKIYQDIFDKLKKLARDNLSNEQEKLTFLSRDILKLID